MLTDNTLITIIHTSHWMDDYISQASIEHASKSVFIQLAQELIPKLYTHCTFRNMVQTLNRLSGHRIVRIYI